MAENLVEIKFDEKKLRKIQLMLRDMPREMPKVMSKAVNITAKSIRAEMARRIANETNMKVGAIKKFGMDWEKATYSRWQSIIGISGRRIPLIGFKGTKQIKTGVSYQIKKTGGRQTIKSTFIAVMQSGHKGVFKREGEARLPIVELRGPSIGRVFEDAAGLARTVTQSAYKKLEQNIDAQVAYILKKRKGTA